MHRLYKEMPSQMKTIQTIETLYCDICKSEKTVKEFLFEYWKHDGGHLAVFVKEAHVCVSCQELILKFIALESGGTFSWSK